MLGSLVMLGLGALRFGVSRETYQTMTRSAAFRWAEQPRLGRGPAMQFLGPEAEEVTLEGVIFPHFRGGLRQIELMRLIAATGQPQILVDGMGFVWNRWCITTVEETRTLALADGAPRQIDFVLTLRTYGEDAGSLPGAIGRLFG